MPSHHSWIFFVTALALAPVGAASQGFPGGPGSGGASPQRLRVGFGGGASVPTRQAGDVLKRGINGQGFVLVSPGAGLPSLRFNLGYQKFDLKEALAAGAAGAGESQVISGIAGLSLDLMRIGPIRPYVLAGLGAFNVRDQLAAAGSSTTSETRFGIDGGAGFALKLGRLEAFLEGRLQNVYTSDRGVVDAKSVQYVPVTFGIIF